MSAVDVVEARRRLDAGDSARRIAADLGVAPSTVTRALAQDARRTPDAQPPAIGPPAPVSGPAPPSAHDRGPRPLIGARAVPEGPPRPVLRPVLGPPDDERSARLWHCPRCALAGFDRNRGEARAWHTPVICDEKVRRLDRGLDDSPRPFDLMTVQW